MKLGKLLGAGKSFFGWQGAIQYRSNKRVYLPKFNPGRNPFSTKPVSSAAPEPMSLEAMHQEAMQLDSEPLAAESVMAAPLKSVEPAPILVSAPVLASAPAAMLTVQTPVAEKVAAAARPEPKASPFSANPPARTPNWTEKIWPFSSRPAKTPPVSMPNVQPEFTLSAVKVVHNDLSDADVDVVPMKSRSVGPAHAPAASVPMEFLGEPVLKSF